MATRLYLHAATNITSGLPTAEQSSLTADTNAEGSQTTNRQMTTDIGSSQASLGPVTFAALTHEYYFTRFVSPSLDQTSVAANTWIYNFATSQNQSAANFPVAGTNQPVRVNCYIWRPSTQTKIGTILDGNTSSTVDTDPQGNVETVHHVTFSGSAVSSIQTGDVIIFEVWFIITPAAPGRNGTFYYDGTTENTTDNASASSHASFLETPETITFGSPSQTFVRNVSDNVTLSESTARVKINSRAPTADSVSLSESVARALTAERNVSDIVSLSESIERFLTLTRTVATDIITLSEFVEGAKLFVRNVAADTVTLGESVARVISYLRNPSDSVSLSEQVQRFFTTVRSASDPSIALSESIERVRIVPRTLQDTVSTSESVVRLIEFIRNIPDSILLSEDVSRAAIRVRSPTADSISLSESVEGFRKVFRTVQDSISLSESVARVYEALRNVSDSIILSESVLKLRTVPRTVQDTIVTSELVEHFKEFTRTVTPDSVSQSESVVRVVSFRRTVTDPLITVFEAVSGTFISGIKRLFFIKGAFFKSDR